jgi:nucleoside-diphosphate-sugar epimerase
MPTWLVTGATGFLGSHVLHALGALPGPAAEVVVLGRRRPEGWPASSFVPADLDDAEGVRLAVEPLAPSVVIHTAGRTPPAPADQLYRTNALGTVHLLDALRQTPARVVLAGSAAELGPVERADLPVGESYPCRPAGAYGLSKWLATAAGLAARPPLEVVVARIFNPIGPGLAATQAFGRFAAGLRAHDPDPLTLIAGDLDSRRDFIDVRDVARALIALATLGRPGLVYHVGTGCSHRVGDGLERLIRLSGRAVHVESRPEPVGARGPIDSRADIRRIVEHTGWRPQISWDQSLEDLWDDAGARPRLPLTGAVGPV